MTSAFVTESNKLKNVQTNLEKSEQILLEHFKKYGDLKVAEFHEQLELARKKELNIMQNEVINVLNPLNKFKTLTIAKNFENLDLKQIKKEMVLLAENIKYISHKTKQYIEKLREEEKQYNDEVKTYEAKITDWEKNINFTFRSVDFNYTNNKLQQNVTDFLTFLSKNGGHCNGWSTDDHNLFLKTRLKCRDINELCSYLHAILPDISEEEIQAHEKWYLKYYELKQKQKQAIKTWRKAKSAALPHKKSNDSQNKRATSSYNKDVIMNRKEIRDKLEKWKQEKIEKQEAERILRQEMEKQNREIEYKRKQKYEEIRKTIESWRLEKLEKTEAELYEKHNSEKQQRIFKSAMANRLIKEFQSQDEVFLQRRIESCKPKSKSVEKITPNIYAERDPNRLLKPTKQWISRIKRNEENYKFSNDDPASVKAIQKLAIPEWRKNISIIR